MLNFLEGKKFSNNFSIAKNKIENGDINKVEEFYSKKGGEKLLNENNYPIEIINYLNEEKKLICKLLTENNYEAILEIGCMRARNANIAKELNIFYGGIDLVERFISKGKYNLVKENIKGKIKALSVNNINHINTPIQGYNKILAFFPFNCFGNIEDIHSAIINLYNLKYDVLILTYLTNNFSNLIREKYYGNCGYSGFKRIKSDNYIGYYSIEGLNSKSYNCEYLIKLLKKYGFITTTIKFGEIGIGYYGKIL